MTDAAFPAFHFDGRSSRAIEVDVRIEGSTLVLGSAGLSSARWPFQRLVFAEHFARTPRMIELPDGATLEVPDADGRFDDALRAQGVLPGVVQRMQGHRYAAVIALALCVALAAYAYVDGIPAVARAIAMHVPMDVEQRLGAHLLADADTTLFGRTHLDARRRARLEARFAAAAHTAAPDVHYQVVWRRMGRSNQANALTLPGGTIVMLDGLVADGVDDDALVGVFGHELGHVAGRHTLRQMIQVAGVGGLASMVWGDMSSSLLNGAVAISSLKYSRDMESEADAFAAKVLKANQLSAEPLIQFLSTMEARESAKSGGAPPGLLATHPLTGERIERLRALMARP